MIHLPPRTRERPRSMVAVQEGNQRPVKARCLPIEWRIGISLLITASILSSGLFDTVMIQVLGFREVDRQIRIMVALVLAAHLGLMLLTSIFQPVPNEYKRRQRPAFEIPLKGFLLLLPVWALAGIINRWPITYVLGDIFLLAIMPLTYFALTRRPMDRPRQFFKWLYALMLVLAVASCWIVIQHNIIDGNRHKMSVDAVVPPTFYIMLKTFPHPAEILLIPFFIICALLTSKRSTWASLALFICLALVLRPGIRRSVRLLLATAAIALTVLILMDTHPQWVQQGVSLVSYRWEETKEDLTSDRGEFGKSSGGRMSEALGVVDTIRDRRNPVDWVTGLGLGAMVQARGGRLRHHVHSTPMAFLARTGVPGLLMWSAFMFLVLHFLWRSLHPRMTEWYRVQVLFWIGIWMTTMLFSLKSQMFWGSAAGGITLAYSYHVCRLAAVYTEKSTVKNATSLRRRRGPLLP